MSAISPVTRARARGLRKAMTPQERRLWTGLRGFNRTLGTNFRKQAPIGCFIADFADLGRRLVIEADGAGHASAADASRDAWFAAQGFRVLRFWNPEIATNLDGVLHAVLDALDTCTPPHQSGNGTP
jgi:very-short-patch-repair endonuclease